jgi:hypothetical protein
VGVSHDFVLTFVQFPCSIVGYAFISVITFFGKRFSSLNLLILTLVIMTFTLY